MEETALTRDTDTMYLSAKSCNVSDTLHDLAERSADSAERSPDLANRSHEQDDSPRPIFNTPWSAATRSDITIHNHSLQKYHVTSISTMIPNQTLLNLRQTILNRRGLCDK